MTGFNTPHATPRTTRTFPTKLLLVVVTGGDIVLPPDPNTTRFRSGDLRAIQDRGHWSVGQTQPATFHTCFPPHPTPPTGLPIYHNAHTTFL